MFFFKYDRFFSFFSRPTDPNFSLKNPSNNFSNRYGLIIPGIINFINKSEFSKAKDTIADFLRCLMKLICQVEKDVEKMDNDCPVKIDTVTYRHNQVLHILVSKLTTLFADHQDVRVYADLNGFRFNESPQEIIPSTVLITPYCPDLILYNSHSSLMGIIELTCPLDSRQHLESAHCQKQQ